MGVDEAKGAIERLAPELAAPYGVAPESLHLLQHTAEGDGAVYRALAGAQPVVFKVMALAPEGLGPARAKAAFVRYLAEHGAPVARPLASRGGELLEAWPVEGALVGATASAWAPGRPPDGRNPAVWNAALFSRWGEAAGRLHALAREYPWGYPPADGSPPPVGTWREEHAGFCTHCRDAEVLERWQEIGETLAHLPQPPEAYGLIHNDLHAHNMLVDESGALTVIDWDCASYFWFVSDIATGLHSTLAWSRSAGADVDREGAARFLGAYLEGYRRAYTLGADWLERLPLFLRYRDALLCIVFQGAWPEPRNAWQRSWLENTRGRVLARRPIVALDWGAL